MAHHSNEAAVHPEADRAPRDHVSKSAGSPEHAQPAAGRRSWFPPGIEDFEITPEAAMYAGRR